MKKRNLTMDKQIRIYGLALLVFLVICGSQDVLAADIAINPVILNVNAATQVAPALTRGKVNQFTFMTSGSGILQNVLTNWTEKAVFGSVIAATGTDTPVDAEVKITVSVKAPTSSMLTGDLIVKVDQMVSSATSSYNTTAGAINTTGGAFSVYTTWLKYHYSAGPIIGTTSSAISFVADGGTLTAGSGYATLDKDNLKTLPLVRFGHHYDVDPVSGRSTDTASLSTTTANTITLLDFFAMTNIRGPAIITAVLVDSVDNPNPQVMGVDVKTIFFNYVDPTLDPEDYRPIWLYLIQTGGSTTNS